MFVQNKSDKAWNKAFKLIESKHNSAYYAIDMAIKYEELEKPEKALDEYKRGIELIDEALHIPITSPDHPDETWKKAVTMIQKMKRSRAEVLMRINQVQQKTNSVQTQSNLSRTSVSNHSLPETNTSGSTITNNSSEAVSCTSSPTTYSELAVALQNMEVDPVETVISHIIYRHEGVKVYFISNDAEVVSITEPQVLQIISTQEDNGSEKIHLQIGDLVYPLVPGVSPCLRTEYGAFILPNVYKPGESIGIILPEEADAEVYDLLENILHGIVGHPPEASTEVAVSDKVSSGMVEWAFYLSQGLVKGAQKIGEYMNYGTPRLINNIEPAPQPTEISSGVIRGVHIAETATNKVAQATGYMAEKIGLATFKLGQFLAPHIQSGGTKVLSRGFGLSEADASDKMSGLLTVAAGAVEGFATIYRGLETSASILGNSLKNNTVKVVEHKYGVTAAGLAGETLSTVGNVYTIGQNARVLRPKSLVRKTGTAVAYEFRNPPRPTSLNGSTGKKMG